MSQVKYVKMTQDVMEGIKAREMEKLEGGGERSKRGQVLKFAKDEVVPMHEASAKKFVDRKLGVIVDPPAQPKAEDAATKEA